MKSHLALAVSFLAAMLWSAWVWAEPSIYPTGVTRYDPSKADNVFVLFSGGDLKTHLIDMDGSEVHRWDHNGFPSGLLDPALIGGKRGHVILWLGIITDSQTGTIPGLPLGYKNKVLGELDWDGSIVWQWGDTAPGGGAQQHHDWSRLSTGNTLVLSTLARSIPGFALPQQLDEVIYEVTANGEIVWKWAAGDHLDEFGFTPAALELVRKSDHPDYLHVNNMRPVGSNHWFREGDVRFDPENILISSRDANFTIIIDRKSGHIAWRLGPNYAPRPLPSVGWPDAARQLPAEIDQISGQHDAHIVPEGLPGAGNLLLFDNQGEAGYPPVTLRVLPGSRVLEIDPVNQRVVWEYAGTDNDRPQWSFYSSFISSARRLPNGNTLINEGMNGRAFQVTRDGEIGWEYVSPYFGPAPLGPAGKKLLTNWIYRAQPVPYDWVPSDTPHSERAVVPPDIAAFRVPTER
jgi:Arylsulfotransferase (ASST)